MHYLNYNVLHLMLSRVFGRNAMDYPVSITNVKIYSTNSTNNNKTKPKSPCKPRPATLSLRTACERTDGQSGGQRKNKRANKPTEMTANLLLLVYTACISL